jgi:O-antigen ligase
VVAHAQVHRSHPLPGKQAVIRLTLLTLFVTGLALYAWRDWYKSLCGLILLVAVIQHPDMPKSILGIQGLNPWNILLAVILAAWLVNRRREGLTWDMPRHLNLLLFVYLLLIVVGFSRMLGDTNGIEDYAVLRDLHPPTTSGIWSEDFVNTIKWVIPGLLLFDGCRTRSRFLWGVTALLGIYFLLAVQVIKWMPISYALHGDSLTERSLKILLNEVGFHRVNLAEMLAGAAWAVFALRPMAARRSQAFFITLASIMMAYALALTAGRTGFVTWAVVGLILCLIRWRKYLLFIPVVVVLIVWLMPGTYQRLSQGFTPETRDFNARVESTAPQYDNTEPDLYTITAGRNVAWPYVLEKIRQAPAFGFGREAMQRTGVSSYLWNQFGEDFPHPHNAYLQWILDNGWAGFIPILVFYFLMAKYSVSLFRDSRSPTFVAIGGVTLSLVAALLVGSIGSQTFYPREGAVGMWCAIGLMLRIFVERDRALAAAKGSSTQSIDNRLWRSAA